MYYYYYYFFLWNYFPFGIICHGEHLLRLPESSESSSWATKTHMDALGVCSCVKGNSGTRACGEFFRLDSAAEPRHRYNSAVFTKGRGLIRHRLFSMPEVHPTAETGAQLIPRRLPRKSSVFGVLADCSTCTAYSPFRSNHFCLTGPVPVLIF